MRWLPLLFCVAASAQRLYVSSHPAMGTEYKLYLYATDNKQAADISEAVFDEVDRVDDLLSNYKADSELSRINREAAAHSVRVEPEVFDFLQQSQRWAEASGGAFDITVGRLMKVWGFYRHAGAIPPAAELSRAMKSVGYRRMHLDSKESTVSFDTPGVELDPGGIGKGFAVDAAVAVLKQWRVSAAMLSAGGSTVYALGAPPGERGWKAVVSSIAPSHETLSTLWLRDTSMSIANCTEKNFVQNGTLYCHIMDPHAGQPVVGRLQVAVLHPSATASDALSNVLFVMPAKNSFAVLRKFAPASQALVLEGTDPAKARASCLDWPAEVRGVHCALP